MRLCCLGIKDNDEICFIDKNVYGRGAMIRITETTNDHAIIFDNKSKTKTIELKSWHMSCKSDKIDTSTSNDYLGIVLYSNKNKTDWYCNGIHCKTGYMFIKVSKSFLDDTTHTRHAQLYKLLFNQWPDENVIGAGFAIQSGEIKFKSYTFNCDKTSKNQWKNDCQWHDSTPICHEIEQKWIKIALKNWKNGKQNTPIQEPHDICWNCILKINQIEKL